MQKYPRVTELDHKLEVCWYGCPQLPLPVWVGPTPYLPDMVLRSNFYPHSLSDHLTQNFTLIQNMYRCPRVAEPDLEIQVVYVLTLTSKGR